MLSSSFGIAGRYKLEVYRGGILIKQTPWFDNLITNAGLDYLGQTYSATASRVGSGNTPPAYTDTKLVNEVASSGGGSRIGGTIEGFYNTDDPTLYYTYAVIRYQYAIGAVVGSIAEVGIGLADPLFSRSLIKDEDGNPTEITLTSADQLYVLYEHRLYASTADSAITFEANGVTQTGTKRMALWQATLGWAVRNMCPIMTNNRYVAYSGSSGLGPITGNPSGTATGGGSVVYSPYVPGSHFRDSCCYFGGSGTINAFMIGSYSGTSYSGGRVYQAAWQFFFSPGIPKTATQTLQLCSRISWGRYEP
jgi:hypothetical protein